ncbi:chemotaxis protein MotB [Plasticicumulans lactativorans]|uniref:Chemotaxis protein MotB n=1 Tax=Plasticicumulans lactativorans TaxID=1133106 RepID=A0A4R2LJX8_9GAMM|nr:flagellar motor protein MotD [Plasticicumulans lactativorans]TCO79685.1 chemotaxis protein MotB [Plasticicumulans lactativorans]
MRPRRRQSPELSPHERWLVSYADFITLLFAFFVVMYAISSVNAGKYRVLSENLTAAFRTPGHSGGSSLLGDGGRATHLDPGGRVNLIAPELRPLPVPPINPEVRPVIDRQFAPDAERVPSQLPPAQAVTVAPPPPPTAPADPLARVERALRESMADLIHFDQVSVHREKNWVELEIKDNLLFPSGSAVLNPQATEPLRRIADVVRDIPNRVQVEGFTDNLPISNTVFRSNWELSAGRAASVVRVLADAGVAPQRLAAIGYGEFRPVADNATAEGRTRNRRVVLVVVAEPDPRMGVQVAPQTQTATPAAPAG